ncbi:hypothetical protein GCM10011415_22640 [Salipiger pallidus]|uniref:Uncharacterized protein n=1 Tax=Salipiger pallidus TaxID=1775170 RepID=A0A8J2ZKE5_9RHOB|nr:hypothetical protein GCM10011415_22640 [Salipiger pallidus]
MEAAFGIVEFVNETGRAHGDLHPAFLVHLAGEIVRQRGTLFDAAAGRTPQITPVARVGIDHQQAAFVQDYGAGGEARR